MQLLYTLGIYSSKITIMRKQQLFPIVLVFLFIVTAAFDNKPAPSSYIKKYSVIAIREMERSGIPASITIAQGIHESSWGIGELATNSNNHFGIKCKKNWQGGSYYKEDDDYDTQGNLQKSCFRSYGSVIDSYMDHTDFLMNNKRYQPLFELSSDDYEAWAHGLKKCGYATDPNYGHKLIETIKKYNLHIFDGMTSEDFDTRVKPIVGRPALRPNAKEIVAPPVFVIPEDYVPPSIRNTETLERQNTAIQEEAIPEPIQNPATQLLNEPVVTQEENDDNVIITDALYEIEGDNISTTNVPKLDRTDEVNINSGIQIPPSPPAKQPIRKIENRQAIIPVKTKDGNGMVQLSRKPKARGGLRR